MFSNPQSIISQLQIPVGAFIADLGAGTGTYSLLLAQKIGSTGKVYACEAQKDLLMRLENESHALGLNNVVPVHANIEKPLGTKLRDASVDWIIVANTLFQIEHHSDFTKEIVRILKPGGYVLVVDWSESFGNLGPASQDVVSESEAVKLFTEQGLRKTPQMIQAGSHHYGIIFTK